MSRYDCRRCDWRPYSGDDAPGPASQLADHAAETGHLACIVCGASLSLEDRQTCADCIALTRSRLAEIVELYALLPGELGHATATPPDAAGGSHSDETRLPGGDALAMLAPGSAGRSQIRGVPLRNGTRSVEHEADEYHDDPASVAFELARTEDDWRHTRREPAGGPATVTSAAGYLNARLGWAAAYHPAFDEFATDVRNLHRRLKDITGNSDRPQVGVPCFDCGADLLREYGQESYRCPRCRREYEAAEYMLAVRAQMEREAS